MRDGNYAVFQEQTWQWRFHGWEAPLNDKAMANEYKNVTSSCQVWANVVGRIDHRAAREDSANKKIRRRNSIS
jgi:L-rhamnose mutarotase